MTPPIRVFLDGQTVVIKPAGLLGRELFDRYRKACDGARYEAERRVQVAPAGKALAICMRLREAGFEVQGSAELAALLHDATRKEHEARESAGVRAEEADERLKARGLALYPFQRDAVRWLAPKDSAILALDMGLGKTLQALVAAPAHAPVLVVCPAVAKGVWRGEAERWRPDLTPIVLAGRGSFRWPGPGEIVITNYDILPDAAKLAIYFDGDGNVSGADAPNEGTVLVLDESHVCKSYKSKRAAAVKHLATAARARGGKTWLLTGTPLLNRPTELWNQLQIAGAEREVFGSWKEFFQLFGGSKDRWGATTWAATPVAEVVPRLGRAMYRKLKKDVLVDLPAKQVQLVDVDTDARTRKLADRIWSKLEAAGIDLEKATDLAAAFRDAGVDLASCSIVREALAVAKIPALLALVEEYEDANEPLVVMSAHMAPVRACAAREGWAKITGEESAEDKSRIVERFQRGELRGVACTIRSAGVGVTLTRASNMVFVDQDWAPGWNEQAQDRINRIGQTRPCLYRVLVADHAMDRHVARLNTRKVRLVASTVDEVAKEPESRVGAGAAAWQLLASTIGRDPQSPDACPDATASERALAGTVEQERAEVLPTPKAARAIMPRAALPRRAASGDVERWAAHGLVQLACLDPDGARLKNWVGFNGVDGSVGHDLANRIARGEAMTEAQWSLVVRLATRYKRQLGPKPEERAWHVDET
jgi:SWI/SNF-related matrix-associated actin-dependent regulator of chromatin subfamily A-like protein 1